MALQHSNTADAWTPADFGSLVNLAVQSKSVAFQAATIHQTDKVKVNFPLWVSDPTVGSPSLNVSQTDDMASIDETASALGAPSVRGTSASR